ncbi:general secretion pathway protein I [Vibrio ichthyoenteri ATCC 700023]|uniref:Type II secretion system protein I n=1 Tax=Vibrio ichthyoenteri ATCC 700023 TaxID=870968 RepID=F9S5E8_9VIBR|nr:type II secretion system minor pseudopilin GspI [Vibrio ichthyoenteri]EGU35890.1 general secretion pathway protein I [Vibrio ichthyoenteri ATCC 700023]
MNDNRIHHKRVVSKPRGFTLLEVLVALAIFAMSAMALVRSVGQHINTLSFMEEKAFAAMVVDNQMAKVMLNPDGLKKQNGQDKLADRTWYWSVSPVSTQDSLIRAFDVSVASSQKGTPILTVRSYVAK